MERIVRQYTSHDEMKADEYRYWRGRPVWERMDAVEELIETAYALKGWTLEPMVFGKGIKPRRNGSGEAGVFA
jgi:hypothetical protein